MGDENRPNARTHSDRQLSRGPGRAGLGARQSGRRRRAGVASGSRRLSRAQRKRRGSCAGDIGRHAAVGRTAARNPECAVFGLGIGDLRKGGAVATLVDINSASSDELDRLGGRFGKAIVRGRPYQSIDDLVSRRILNRSTFGQIRDRIVAR
jgi:hypothetical protein